MTFNAFEKSTEQGQPVELYEFSLNAVATRFTSSEEDVTYLNTYTAISISRNNFAQATGESTENLVMKVPASLEFVQQFILTPPGTTAQLALHRYHLTDPDAEVKTIWRGKVTSVAFTGDGHTAEIHAVPASIVMIQSIPRFKYSSLCNHMLYDPRCKISEHDPAFEKFLPCTAVDGETITLTGAGAFGATFFEAGFVEFLQDFRLVLKQSTDDLKLLLPFQQSPEGETVRVLAGCKLRLSDCRDKFNNVINFGGFPYIPTKNPFATGLD